jgi:transcriptional regulator with XRE-family HTH domain
MNTLGRVCESSIATRLREERAQQKLSMARLAGKAGVSSVYIWQIESGRAVNPGVYYVEKIASALGVKPQWLAWGEI